MSERSPRGFGSGIAAVRSAGAVPGRGPGRFERSWRVHGRCVRCAEGGLRQQSSAVAAGGGTERECAWPRGAERPEPPTGGSSKGATDEEPGGDRPRRGASRGGGTPRVSECARLRSLWNGAPWRLLGVPAPKVRWANVDGRPAYSGATERSPNERLGVGRPGLERGLGGCGVIPRNRCWLNAALR